MTEERAKRKLSGILSADAVGYSRLMEGDEASTIRTLEDSKRLMSQLIEQFIRTISRGLADLPPQRGGLANLLGLELTALQQQGEEIDFSPTVVGLHQLIAQLGKTHHQLRAVAILDHLAHAQQVRVKGGIKSAGRGTDTTDGAAQGLLRLGVVAAVLFLLYRQGLESTLPIG